MASIRVSSKYAGRKGHFAHVRDIAERDDSALKDALRGILIQELEVAPGLADEAVSTLLDDHDSGTWLEIRSEPTVVLLEHLTRAEGANEDPDNWREYTAVVRHPMPSAGEPAYLVIPIKGHDPANLGAKARELACARLDSTCPGLRPDDLTVAVIFKGECEVAPLI